MVPVSGPVAQMILLSADSGSTLGDLVDQVFAAQAA